MPTAGPLGVAVVTDLLNQGIAACGGHLVLQPHSAESLLRRRRRKPCTFLDRAAGLDCSPRLELRM